MSKYIMRLRDALPTIEDLIHDQISFEITSNPDAAKFDSSKDVRVNPIRRSIPGPADYNKRPPMVPVRCFVAEALKHLGSDQIIQITIPEPVEA